MVNQLTITIIIWVKMERIVNIFNNYKDAKKNEILQEINMTPEERLYAAKILRERVYGSNTPDVRDNIINESR
jgi:hypothetical protein